MHLSSSDMTLLRWFSLRYPGLYIPPPPFHLKNPLLQQVHGCPQSSPRASVARNSLSGSEDIEDDIMQIFVKERKLNGDLISKVSDMLWWREQLEFLQSETSSQENIQQIDNITEDEREDGFLKLSKTHKWISGSNDAPVNKRLVVKDWQNDSEKRKKLDFLKYEALKRELLLLTTGIGAACSMYCLVQLSTEGAVSYAAGVLFSCLYLQLLFRHTDNLTKEAIPKIFMQKKQKRIGIRSEDLQSSFEKTLSGSAMALSSPRLVIPAAIYGAWALSQHFLNGYFNFQIVPAFLGFFAYKAAALVQVYRDNEDLLIVFPDEDGSSSS